MKTKTIAIHALCATCAVFLAFTQCTKEPKVEPNITFENVNTLRPTVYADQNQASQVIQFTTTGAWTSTVNPAAGSRESGTPNWVLISPSSGNTAGNYTVTVYFGTNATGADRRAVIMLDIDGSLVSITPTQKATTQSGEIPTTPTLPTVPIQPL
ncbi:MAG: hypothetical protein LBU90_05590 [Bacteroidales bacterium]|jgi:hypothetical protein|nr:hypothetical protein [Bacteroidales bacterium]